MNTILLILLGAIIWQLVTFIVMVVSSEDDELTMRVGCGVVLMLFNLVMTGLKFVRKFYIRRNYLMYMVCSEKGSDCASMQRVRIKKGAENKYYTKGENEYYIEKFTPTWKSFEREDNIKHVRKHGWYCQKWVNENLVKTN